MGGGISQIPILGKVLALPFQLPDIAYDLYDLYKKPSIANAVHLGLDFPAKWTKTKYDDWLIPLGIVDDAHYGFTGKNIEDEAKEHRREKRSLESAGKRQ